MRISDWSSDVCSSDLAPVAGLQLLGLVHEALRAEHALERHRLERHEDHQRLLVVELGDRGHDRVEGLAALGDRRPHVEDPGPTRDRRGVDLRAVVAVLRSEEHTSELQSLIRISYAGFCLKKKKQKPECTNNISVHTT